ncbi:MAG: 23S rRNA (guanosine(2251)-2'-O)-methyltransferase RlmB [Bacteroidales bacterium]|nr:23S rRNA (guanosine(2251)-2'-O)-methyltransferase RlmB [Bacteroidales bacterium]
MKKENFIFGIRPVIEAIKSGKEMDRILLQKNLRGESFRELFNLIRDLEIPFQFVPIEKLNRLSKQNHQGVIAYVTDLSYQKIEDILPLLYEQGRVPLILLLDGITDVRNMGAIARTAECAGVDAIVIPLKGSAMINSEAIKTSAGALYKIPVCRTSNPKEAVTLMKESGLQIMAATEKGSRTYLAADFTNPMLLIMGSEGAGISDELLLLCDDHIMIPLAGEIESLNVSVASGVILFEIIRQRNKTDVHS